MQSPAGTDNDLVPASGTRCAPHSAVRAVAALLGDHPDCRGPSIIAELAEAASLRGPDLLHAEEEQESPDGAGDRAAWPGRDTARPEP
jgi:hypothetical protein